MINPFKMGMQVAALTALYAMGRHDDETDGSLLGSVALVIAVPIATTLLHRVIAQMPLYGAIRWYWQAY